MNGTTGSKVKMAISPPVLSESLIVVCLVVNEILPTLDRSFCDDLIGAANQVVANTSCSSWESNIYAEPTMDATTPIVALRSVQRVILFSAAAMRVSMITARVL